MKRFLICTACLGALLTAGLPVTKAQAAVSFSLRIGDRYRGPQLAFYSQPDVVLIPGTEVYYVENADYDLYRYGDYWYYYYDGGWYRADDIDGPFYFISYTSIPTEIRYVPVSYRHHWRSWRGSMYGSYRNGYWYRSGNPGYTSYDYQRNRTSYYPTRTYQTRTYYQYQRNRATYENQPQNRQYYPTRNYIQQQDNRSRDYNQVNRREVPQQGGGQRGGQRGGPPQGKGQGHGNGHGNGRGHNDNGNGNGQ